MVKTLDRRAGPLLEEEIQLEDNGAEPSVPGAITYNAGDIRMRDGTGIFNPRTGGTGLTEEQHKVIRQAIHLAEEGGPWEGFTSGAYLEVLPSGSPFPTSEIWYTNSGKTGKIVEVTTSYNANKTINTVITKVYDTDGSTLLITFTDTYTYNGVFVSAVTRSWST